MKRGGFQPRAQPLSHGNARLTRTPFKPRENRLERTEFKSGGRGSLGRTGDGGAKPATPQQARRRLQLATWAEVKQAAHQRDGWRCVGCGTDRDLDCQHRQNKGMGGSKQRDTIANALTLCRTCHRFADQHKNSEGAARGWTVPDGTDPAMWPIRAYDGCLYLHDNDGERRRVG